MTGCWRAWAATGGCLLAVVTAGCSESTDPAPAPDAAATTSAPPAPVPELQPGAPGEEATTRSPGAAVEDGRADEDDVAFMQMMVLHHRQALDMAGLAEAAASPGVREAAARIEAAQSAEILLMAQWLTDRSIDVPAPGADPADYDHAQHGHAGMEGLLTPAELDELEEAEGPPFDRLFVEGMIRHHDGAIRMARQVLAEGTDPRVSELATDVVAEQGAEVSRLRALLDELRATG